MTKLIIFCLLLSTSVFAQKKTDPVVATVNGKKIMLSHLESTYKQNLLFVSNKKVSKMKVLNDIINRELGINRAKAGKLQNDEVVKYKMEDVLYHAQVSKDLAPKFKKIVVTDDDVKKYYSSFPEYRTAQVLIRMRTQPSKEEETKAVKLAVTVYNAATKNPDSFSQLANKYSQSTSALNGGDMGFQPASRLTAEYFEAIRNKSPNYIAPPVKSQFGLHVIKVLAVKKFKDINMGHYRKIVYDIKRDKIMGQYFTEIRFKAKIKVDKKLVN
jgi:parvulin-like peptidyl-prolyl isomerase